MPNRSGIFRLIAVIALVLVSLPLFAAPPQSVVIEGTRPGTIFAYNNTSFYYLPFDVPVDVTKLTIEREMATEPSGNVGLTTSVYDQRGVGFAYNGFRGTQDFGNDPIVITGDNATTTRHFYPGLIQPGRWHIVQHFRWKGAAVQSVRYKYTIKFSFDGPKTDAMPVISYDPVINAKAGWYAADLHSHTNHSDGTGTLDESVAFHEGFGYDIQANTDHNTMSAQFDLPVVGPKHPSTLILSGEEVSTFNGHANVIGSKPGEWYDYRMTPGDGRLPALLDKVHRDGGLFSLNHPFAGKLSYTFPKDEWAKADAIEVWNGNWHGGDDRQTTELWDGLLKAGRHITGIGGSDTHAKEGNLTMFCWVWADSLSRTAVVDGIRKGRVFISYKKTGPLAYLTVPGSSALPGDTVRIGNAETVPVSVRVVGGQGMFLRLVWQDGETKLPIDRTFARISFAVPIHTERSYVRVEVQDAKGTVFGLTNPVYFERDK